MKVNHKNLKSLKVTESGRSSDLISPTIVQGCAGNCRYCYAARYFPGKFYGNVMISDNIDEVIEKMRTTDVSDIQKPNQTHEKYITWDVACNADLLPALNHFEWEKLFDYFKYSERDMGTLASKFVNPMLLKYNPERKVRVRMSIMPPHLSNLFEPKTAKVEKRIHFMNDLYRAGYDVHVNFSPVILYQGWEVDYCNLFHQMNEILIDEVKSHLGAEVIFLTHNKGLHEYNLKTNFEYENLLWNNYQENKVSGNGNVNVRYNRHAKAHHINEFKTLLGSIIPGAYVRYIF